MPDNSGITLLVNGMRYSGWLGLGVERAIDRLGSHFSITVTEAWSGQDVPWQIGRFDGCQILIDGQVVLTGYVDDYAPSYDAQSHTVTISGRSKTQDLVDCSPDISSGQFKGYTLGAIATSVCALFKIGTVQETDTSQTFPDATLQRGETGFTFLERLGRLAGVLLTDDELGNLVLTRTGTKRAGGSLVHGVNILRARGKLSADKRFSHTIVKGQRAIGSAAGQSESGGGGDADPAPVATNLRAVALDRLVPRYRPKVCMAEAQQDAAAMQQRANWMRNYAFGRSTECEIDVLDYYDADGALWRINRLIGVSDPWLQIDQDLLIAGVSFRIDDRGGRITTLRLGPVEGFTPDPGEVKAHCKHGKGHGHGHGARGPDWDGAGM